MITKGGVLFLNHFASLRFTLELNAAGRSRLKRACASCRWVRAQNTILSAPESRTCNSPCVSHRFERTQWIAPVDAVVQETRRRKAPIRMAYPCQRYNAGTSDRRGMPSAPSARLTRSRHHKPMAMHVGLVGQAALRFVGGPSLSTR